MLRVYVHYPLYMYEYDIIEVQCDEVKDLSSDDDDCGSRRQRKRQRREGKSVCDQVQQNSNATIARAVAHTSVLQEKLDNTHIVVENAVLRQKLIAAENKKSEEHNNNLLSLIGN